MPFLSAITNQTSENVKKVAQNNKSIKSDRWFRRTRNRCPIHARDVSSPRHHRRPPGRPNATARPGASIIFLSALLHFYFHSASRSGGPPGGGGEKMRPPNTIDRYGQHASVAGRGWHACMRETPSRHRVVYVRRAEGDRKKRDGGSAEEARAIAKIVAVERRKKKGRSFCSTCSVAATLLLPDGNSY